MNAIVSPAEVVRINPEHLEIANAYLASGSIEQVAIDLDIPRDLVTSSLERREVKAYIDRMYFDAGFNNRFKLNELMEILIKKKLQEMEEADAGSKKDITELIALQHKMLMDYMDKSIALEKLRSGVSVTNQTNIQINEATNHSKLIDRIIDASKK